MGSYEVKTRFKISAAIVTAALSSQTFADAETPSGVSVEARYSNCELRDSATIELSSDNTKLIYRFAAFEVALGRRAANCTVAAKMDHFEGWTYAVEKVVFEGYAKFKNFRSPEFRLFEGPGRIGLIHRIVNIKEGAFTSERVLDEPLKWLPCGTGSDSRLSALVVTGDVLMNGGEPEVFTFAKREGGDDNADPRIEFSLRWRRCSDQSAL